VTGNNAGMSSAEMANKNSSEATLVAIFREYRNLSWSERLLGKYDYRQLCTPVLIGNETENRSTFFGKDEPIPILLAILMGFQHALGSVGGNVLIVTLATFGAPPTIREYLLSCAFIVSGIVSMLQIAALPVPFTSGRLQIGTGLLSLVGSSSAFVSLFMTQVYGQIVRDPTLSWQQAYGGVVGALMTSSLIGLGMAALPPKALRRLLPPVVSGTTVVLIGTSLADSALQYWGGGILCSRFVQIPAGGCQVVNPATGGQSQRLAAAPAPLILASLAPSTKPSAFALQPLLLCLCRCRRVRGLHQLLHGAWHLSLQRQRRCEVALWFTGVPRLWVCDSGYRHPCGNVWQPILPQCLWRDGAVGRIRVCGLLHLRGCALRQL